MNYVYRHLAGQYTSLVETQIFDQNCIDCHFGNYPKFKNVIRMDKKHYVFIKNKRRCEECHRETGHQTTIGLENKFRP